MKKNLLFLGCAAMLSVSPASAWNTPKGIEKDGEPISEATLLKIPGKNKGISQNGPARLGERNPIIPPFTETFDFRSGMEHEDFEKNFETIDANKDERVWGMYNFEDEEYSRCAYMLYPLDDMPQADDWLITRAIKLEAGKWYCISMDASLFNDGPAHTFEVKYGMFNDVEGLDTSVIPPTEVSTRLKKHVEGWICPEYDGLYYIGVHGISTCHSGYLFIDNIAIDAPMEAGAPSGITDLKVVNSPDGSSSATISFKVPSIDISGAALQEVTSIQVLRDGKLIKTFTGVKPSDACTFEDTTPAAGYYRYTFQCFNSIGDGAIVRHDQFIGMTNPLPPTNASISDDNAGHALLTWEAPATDLNGTAIDPDVISYNIYAPNAYGEIEKVQEGVTGTSFTLDVPADYQQMLVYAAITAVVNGIESNPAETEVIAVGEPYTLPYVDSFVAGSNDYVLGVNNDPDVTWRMLDDDSDPVSQDNDNGYVAMIASMPGQKGEMITGKIKLDDDAAIDLSFFTYVYYGDENEIRIYITDMETGERTELATTLLRDITRVGWNRLSYSLDNYAGKVVRIGIEATIATHGYVPIDNIRIQPVPAIDMAVGEVKAPQSAKAGEAFNVTATVHNYGGSETSDYNVVLLRDNKEIGTLKGTAIARNGSAEFTFTDQLTATSPTMPKITVRVDAEGDANPDDNTSAPVRIAFISPVHPVATALTATESGSAVTLQWTAPDMTKAAPMETSEDFESYEPFATSFGDWSMIDADKGFVGGFSGIEMPGIDGTQQAYWIMPSTDPFFFITPHSGTNAAVQMYGMNSEYDEYVQCDDWLISPELYGGPQTISFWAKSFSIQYGYEVFEVYYSTTDKKPGSFKQAISLTEASDVWTQYFASLPDGAKYFAVRCTSNNIYMFMLDDFSYIPTGTPREINFMGYNVYRNNEKLNTELVTETSFATSRQEETDSYFVTAVYDLGESMPSNVVTLGNASIDSISADNANAPVEFFDLRGIQVDESQLLPGVYVRRQGTDIRKVIIR